MESSDPSLNPKQHVAGDGKHNECDHEQDEAERD
jgi:hypothetical protein